MLLMTKFEGLVVQQPIKESPKRQSLGAFFFFIMWLRKCFYLILFFTVVSFCLLSRNKPSAENTIKINSEKRQEYFQALSGVYKYNRSEK